MSRFILIVSTFLFLVGSFTYSALAQLGDEGFPNTVFAILAEPPGANCPNGGSLIASGRDNNGNGSLGFNEVQQIGYACNGNVGPPGPPGPAGPVGAQGPAGPSGPAGPVGAMGPMGSQGPAGPMGAVGPAGAQGPQGDQGPQGVAGNDGAAGPAGAQGPQGDQGPQGVAGNDGADGADGSDGDDGTSAGVFESGIVSACGGDQNAAGKEFSIFRDLNNNGTFDSGETILDTFEVCNGVDGERGPTGATGAQGQTGPEGPTGPNGAWAVIRTNTCPGGTIATNNTCIYETFCAVGGTAISGMCGDAGNADDILVQYSGRDRTNPRRWQCTVRNFSRQDRTVSLGIYCVP